MIKGVTLINRFMKDIHHWIIKYHNKKISKVSNFVTIVGFFGVIIFLLLSLLLIAILLHKINHNLAQQLFSYRGFIKLIVNLLYIILILIFIFILNIIMKIRSQKENLYLKYFRYLVHENPSFGSKAIGYIKEKEEFQIIDKTDYEKKWCKDWHKISYMEKIGWTHS